MKKQDHIGVIDYDHDVYGNGLGVTINYYAEHYKHEYRIYYYIVDAITEKFICSAKDKDTAEKKIIKQGQQNIWKVQHYADTEKRITRRKEKNREQCQGAHRSLDFDKKQEERVFELFDHDHVKRSNKLIKEKKIREHKKSLQTRQISGSSYLSYEDRVALQGKTTANKLAKMLKGVI